MKKYALAAAVSTLLLSSFGASAAQQVSRSEAEQFKLTHIANVTVSASGGAISSPSDLHKALSDKADAKGGKYYMIIAAKEIGPNFEAIAEVYK